LALLTPTGGLRYHFRAWLYRDTVWKPYVDAVGAWLLEWHPPERALLLVGPSGGYSLPAALLTRFERITGVEPDPVARWIFRRRFSSALRAKGASLEWDRGDWFSPDASGFHIDRLARLVARHPDLAVLFCNFLGQMPLLDRRERHTDSLARWFDALPSALGERSFASYHDRFSAPVRPRVAYEFRTPNALDDEALGTEVYVSATKREDRVDIVSHGTARLFPNRPRAYFSWEIVRGFWHLIEGVRSENPRGDDGPRG